MKIQEKYINRCLALAKNGLGTTYPNPLVGAVIVYEDKIIGEGWHHEAGKAHAEVNAIQQVEDENLLKKSTIYVSLEPCSHFGKTPPCSDLIIAKGIKNVVIGMLDPFEKVAGRGIKKLMEAGCNVQVGVLEEACKELNKRFLTYHLKKRPYVILKWAQSSDGYLSPYAWPEKPKEQAPVWITSPASKQLVHQWRAEEQAILVGSKTALADNPQLNTRLWAGSHPYRVLLDPDLEVGEDHHLFTDGNPTLVLHKANITPKRKNQFVDYHAVEVDQNLPEQILEILYKKGLQSLIIEGGNLTLQTFINKGLWDEARVFSGNAHFGGGTPAPSIGGKLLSEQQINSDLLKLLKND